MMSWAVAFISRWLAARRAARLLRVRQILGKGLSAME